VGRSATVTSINVLLVGKDRARELRAAMEGVPDDLKVSVYDEELVCAHLSLKAELAVSERIGKCMSTEIETYLSTS
jgi:hypothetical protein